MKLSHENYDCWAFFVCHLLNIKYVNILPSAIWEKVKQNKRDCAVEWSAETVAFNF